MERRVMIRNLITISVGKRRKNQREVNKLQVKESVDSTLTITQDSISRVVTNNIDPTKSTTMASKTVM